MLASQRLARPGEGRFGGLSDKGRGLFGMTDTLGSASGWCGVHHGGRNAGRLEGHPY